jgi:hypothetical protein
MTHRDTQLATIEVFTSTKFQNYKHLDRCHVWGSPNFVLDPALQDGKKIPKWNPRSTVGMYLGNSPAHSSTVARVLNLSVNTSGKAGAQIPQLPLGDDSSPGGDNAVCM